MNLKISATFEGKCDLCKKSGIVFTVGDEDTHKAVTICKDCSVKNGSESISTVVEKYGKKDDKAFEPGVRYEKKGVAE